MNKTKYLISLITILIFMPGILIAQEECTVGVAVGKATVDGRALLWKNRDTSHRNNAIHVFERKELPFVGVINVGDTTQVWMGVNAAGFCIMNAESRDMEGDEYDGEGFFMKRALEVCKSVDDFESLLQQTNQPGRTTTSNFGMIDSKGNGAIFETGNHTYTRFNAGDTKLGYVVRSNYALTGSKPQAYGHQRKARAEALFRSMAEQSQLSHRAILQEVSRDLVNDKVNPYPLPFSGRQDTLPTGALYTYNSINRYRTASVAVFHGVLPGENPQLTTMWTILGEPVCGIAFPLWPVQVKLPSVITEGNPVAMNQLIQELESAVYKDDAHPKWLFTAQLQTDNQSGLLPDLLKFEQSIFKEGKNIRQSLNDHFTVEKVGKGEKQIIERIMKKLTQFVQSVN